MIEIKKEYKISKCNLHRISASEIFVIFGNDNIFILSFPDSCNKKSIRILTRRNKNGFLAAQVLIKVTE